MKVLIPGTQATDASKLDLTSGGQNGAMHDPQSLNSTQGYVPQKLIAVLIAAPKAYGFLPPAMAEAYTATLKNLVEVLPLEITGLDSTVTYEFGEVKAGHSGEVVEHIIGAQRARSTPSFRWVEGINRSIGKFWGETGRLLLQDEVSGVAGIIAEPGFQSGYTLLQEDRSFSVLFIEPDSSMKGVVDAWFCTNMMQKTGGEVTGKREVGGTAEVTELTIETTAYTMVGNVVNAMAGAYLSKLDLSGLRPLDLTAFVKQNDSDLNTDEVGISPDVASVTATGFAEKLNAVADEIKAR